MGGVCGTGRVAPEGTLTEKQLRAINKSIDERLAQEQEEEKRVIKCLLLGAGECGKSTIMKQMKILHLNGFSHEEKLQYKPLVWKNTIEAIQTLCTAVDTLLNLQWEDPENKRWSEEVRKIDLSKIDPLKPNPVDGWALDKLRDVIKRLYADRACQIAFQRSNEFHLLDSAPYFLDSVTLDRTFESDYLPTHQDILHARIPTTGIIQTEFKLDKMHFKMFDVGGQRGERKKWIHCFDNVTAIIFIASLSEYDQVLAEDRTRNRMKESLALFEGIVNLPWFKDAPIILFLNKADIFKRKVKTVDIGIYFPAYNGGLDYESGLKFIQEEYFERNANDDKTIYCHVTEATDTENIAFVWKATKHIILEQNLARHGLLMA